MSTNMSMEKKNFTFHTIDITCIGKSMDTRGICNVAEHIYSQQGHTVKSYFFFLDVTKFNININLCSFFPLCLT